jgi:hypothetical protein
MRPEQLIVRFRAGDHRIAIGVTDDGRNVLRLERHIDDIGRTWFFDEYHRARSVADFMRGLSDYQRDALLMEVQP